MDMNTYIIQPLLCKKMKFIKPMTKNLENITTQHHLSESNIHVGFFFFCNASIPLKNIGMNKLYK